MLQEDPEGVRQAVSSEKKDKDKEKEKKKVTRSGSKFFKPKTPRGRHKRIGPGRDSFLTIV